MDLCNVTKIVRFGSLGPDVFLRQQYLEQASTFFVLDSKSCQSQVEESPRR